MCKFIYTCTICVYHIFCTFMYEHIDCRVLSCLVGWNIWDEHMGWTYGMNIWDEHIRWTYGMNISTVASCYSRLQIGWHWISWFFLETFDLVPRCWSHPTRYESLCVQVFWSWHTWSNRRYAYTRWYSYIHICTTFSVHIHICKYVFEHLDRVAAAATVCLYTYLYYSICTYPQIYM